MRWHVVMDAINNIGKIREVKFLPHFTGYSITVVLLEVIKMTFWERGKGGARIGTDQTVDSLLVAVASRITSDQNIV